MPGKPTFYHIEVGFNGIKFHMHVVRGHYDDILV